MRAITHLVLAFVALALIGCGPTTTLEVDAQSLGGATVYYVGNRADGPFTSPIELGTLDATGRGTFDAPILPTDEIDLRFDRDGRTTTAPAVCLPPAFDVDQTIRRASYLMRRSTANGECFLVALEIEQGGTVVQGDYDPTLFDDAPCGPWANGEPL